LSALVEVLLSVLVMPVRVWTQGHMPLTEQA